MATPFRVLTEYGLRMAGTRSRRTLRQLAADTLTAVDPDEVEQTARLLIGKAFPAAQQAALRISAASVWRTLEPIFGQPKEALQRYTHGAVDFASGVRTIYLNLPKQRGICAEEVEPLTILDVYGTLTQIAAMGGGGSRGEKELLLRDLLCRADPDEAAFLVKNIVGEMRHGVNEGLLLEGIATAIDADFALVQRAFMLIGDVGTLAVLALSEGTAVLERLEISLFTPVRPMLAQAVDDVPAAWVRHAGALALEYKLDGARVQIHKRGDEVRLYTRHLMEITGSLPEIADAVRAQITAETAILEGEVVAIGADGAVLPFQELMRRFRRLRDVPRLLQEVPVRVYLFDLLLRDGRSLLESTNAERWAELTQVLAPGPMLHLTPRCLPVTVEEGASFFDQAVDAGHEGLIAKRLEGLYTPGVRGAEWLKIKDALTVDLVIVAAEWGYGRRTGWLSNNHLAARDIVTGDLVEVGKTFKGLTDDEFAEMTAALLDLSADPEAHIVAVRPEIVVEVAFNQIQRSPSYPGGVALRFARIVRFRPDKALDEIDTLQTLRDIYTLQTGQPWQQAA
jgi:DNA ligase-1